VVLRLNQSSLLDVTIIHGDGCESDNIGFDGQIAASARGLARCDASSTFC